MTAADVPAVARLFMKIYRSSDRPADIDLQDYLKAIILEAPSYSEATGAFIYEQQDGRIPSAMLAVPMSFVACGTVVPGRLVCTLMTDKEAAGAAQLVLTLAAEACRHSIQRHRFADHLQSSGGPLARSRFRCTIWNGRVAFVR